MKKLIRMLVVMILMTVIVIPNFGKPKYRNKNIPVKETKTITLKKNTKGCMFLQKVDTELEYFLIL